MAKSSVTTALKKVRVEPLPGPSGGPWSGYCSLRPSAWTGLNRGSELILIYQCPVRLDRLKQINTPSSVTSRLQEGGSPRACRSTTVSLFIPKGEPSLRPNVIWLKNVIWLSSCNRPSLNLPLLSSFGLRPSLAAQVIPFPACSRALTSVPHARVYKASVRVSGHVPAAWAFRRRHCRRRRLAGVRLLGISQVRPVPPPCSCCAN